MTIIKEFILMTVLFTAFVMLPVGVIYALATWF